MIPFQEMTAHRNDNPCKAEGLELWKSDLESHSRRKTLSKLKLSHCKKETLIFLILYTYILFWYNSLSSLTATQLFGAPTIYGSEMTTSVSSAGWGTSATSNAASGIFRGYRGCIGFYGLV